MCFVGCAGMNVDKLHYDKLDDVINMEDLDANGQEMVKENEEFLLEVANMNKDLIKKGVHLLELAGADAEEIKEIRKESEQAALVGLELATFRGLSDKAKKERVRMAEKSANFGVSKIHQNLITEALRGVQEMGRSEFPGSYKEGLDDDVEEHGTRWLERFRTSAECKHSEVRIEYTSLVVQSSYEFQVKGLQNCDWVKWLPLEEKPTFTQLFKERAWSVSGLNECARTPEAKIFATAHQELTKLAKAFQNNARNAREICKAVMTDTIVKDLKHHQCQGGKEVCIQHWESYGQVNDYTWEAVPKQYTWIHKLNGEYVDAEYGGFQLLRVLLLRDKFLIGEWGADDKDIRGTLLTRLHEILENFFGYSPTNMPPYFKHLVDQFLNKHVLQCEYKNTDDIVSAERYIADGSGVWDLDRIRSNQNVANIANQCLDWLKHVRVKRMDFEKNTHVWSTVMCEGDPLLKNKQVQYGLLDGKTHEHSHFPQIPCHYYAYDQKSKGRN